MADDHANTSVLMLGIILESLDARHAQSQPWRRNKQRVTQRFGQEGSYRNRLQLPTVQR